MDASLREPLEACFKIVKFLYLCPVEAETSRKKIVCRRLILVLTLGMACISEATACVKSKTLIEWADHFSVLVPALMVLMKLTSFMVYYDKFELINQELNELFQISYDERFKERLHISKQADFIMKMFKAFVINAFLTTVVYTSVIVFVGKLPYNISGLNTDNNDIAFYVAAVHLVISSVYGNLMYTSLNLLPVIFVSYATGVLNELADRIKLIGRSEEIDQNQEVVKCIQVHERVKNFVQMVEEQYGLIWFCQSIASQVIISLFIFNTSSSHEVSDLIRALVLSLLMVYEIFMPCYFGSQLIEASTKLTDEVYCSNWLNVDLKTKKILVTFMENLKDPIKIGYHELFDADMISFREIIDSAYELYAVLKSISE